MSISETYVRWRYRLIPDHVVGELLSKDWIDNAIPVLMLAIVVAFFGTKIPGFFGLHSLIDTGRQLGEYLFPALGMTVVLLAGGIDLSVGSNFALCNFAAIALVNYFQLPLMLVFPAVILVGGTVGLINGLLVGYLRLRAFLTTLVTLIFVRAIVDLLSAQVRYQGFYLVGRYSRSGISLATVRLLACRWISSAALVVAAIAHVVLTRMRFGWHLFAVGGSRRSAHNVGISVRQTVCLDVRDLRRSYSLRGFVLRGSAQQCGRRNGSGFGNCHCDRSCSWRQ